MQLHPLLKYGGGKPRHNEPEKYKLEQLLFSIIYFKIRQHNKQDTTAELGFLSSASFFVFHKPILLVSVSLPPFFLR